MSLKLNNEKALSKYILGYILKIEKALIYQLEYLVAELENHAKLNAEYIDQTSNLKGSIGGVVLKDGRPISYKGFEGSGKDGATKGRDFLDTLIKQVGVGYVIIIVAGMEYATYVENYHGLNVLMKSELKMEREIPKILQRLKAKLK